MLQLIERFVSVDKEIANIAEKKMRLRLWYLSENLAALPLLVDNISDEEKRAIVSALQKEPLPDDLRRLAPNKISQFWNLLKLPSLLHGAHSACLNLSPMRRLGCCSKHMG